MASAFSLGWEEAEGMNISMAQSAHPLARQALAGLCLSEAQQQLWWAELFLQDEAHWTRQLRC